MKCLDKVNVMNEPANLFLTPNERYLIETWDGMTHSEVILAQEWLTPEEDEAWSE